MGSLEQQRDSKPTCLGVVNRHILGEKRAELSTTTDPIVYTMRPEEMARRKTAFSTFILFVFLSVLLASIDFLIHSPRIAIPTVTGLGMLLLVARFLFFRSADSYAKRRVSLTNTAVVISGGMTSHEVMLQEVKSWRVKITTSGNVREITLRIDSGRSFGIDGLVGFEQFEERLAALLSKEASRSELKELIDFDHPLFYVVLGVIVGSALSGAVRLASILNAGALLLMNLVVSTFILFTGVYWIVTKPVVATYGPTAIKVDRIVASVLIGIGVVVCLLGFVGI